MPKGSTGPWRQNSVLGVASCNSLSCSGGVSGYGVVPPETLTEILGTGSSPASAHPSTPLDSSHRAASSGFLANEDGFLTAASLVLVFSELVVYAVRPPEFA